ncbi:MAG: hypothetical protein JXR49_01240 [Acidobacteria bacterium]|nr:hypothetical protein [Acidobacteriota bacterium]
MTKKWIAINLLLLILAGITGRQLYVSVQEFKAENDLSKIQPDRSLNQEIAQEAILQPPIKNLRYNTSDFAVIPEKNLFSESRSREDSGESPVQSGTMPASQRPILVGVILTEDQKIASILEPRGRGRNSEVQMKRVGDEYAGYTVAEIESDHIVLDNNGQKEIITLDDSAQTARRGRTSNVPTRVVSIGGGATTGNIPVSVVAGGTGASRTPPASAARTVNPQADNNVRNTVVAVSGIQPGGQQTDPTAEGNAQQQGNTQSPKSQTPVPTPAGIQRDPRVIRTPFGDIIRPDP